MNKPRASLCLLGVSSLLRLILQFAVVKLCPTEISHSQLWRPLLDYRWKTEGNNAPLEVFSSAKIVLLTTVLETSSIAEVISSRANLFQ